MEMRLREDLAGRAGEGGSAVREATGRTRAAGVLLAAAACLCAGESPAVAYTVETIAPASRDLYDSRNAFTADFDGDGLRDLASWADSQMYWWPGTGAGVGDRQFAFALPQPWLSAAYAGDVDDDGRAEMLLLTTGPAGSAEGRVRVYQLEPASGRFLREPVQEVLVGAGWVQAVIDVDGDGIKDLVYGRQEPARLLWRRGGMGVAAPLGVERELLRLPSSRYDPYQVSLGDVDGDGDADILLTGNHDEDAQGEFFIALYTRAAGVDASYSEQGLTLTSQPTYLSLADLTGDGRADILSRHPHFEPTRAPLAEHPWYENTAQGFEPRRLPGLSDCERPHDWHQGDVDNDGDLDLLLATVEVCEVFLRTIGPVIYRGGALQFLENRAGAGDRYHYVETFGGARFKAPGEAGYVLNGRDGEPDGLVATALRLRQYRRDEAGQWHETRVLGGIATPVLLAGDIDPDGQPALLELTNGVARLHRRADTGWEVIDLEWERWEHSGVMRGWLEDIDGDDVADLVYALPEADGAEVVAYRRHRSEHSESPDEIFQERGTLLRCTSRIEIDFADLDDNGLSDLAFACQNTDARGDSALVVKARMRERAPSGDFRTRYTVEVLRLQDGAAGPVGLADLDGDEAADIVVVNAATQQLWFASNRIAGEQGFARPRRIATDIGLVEALYLVDLDQDGRRDIILSASGWGRWMRNLSTAGELVFAAPQNLPAARGDLLQFVDLNQDGADDILLRRGDDLLWFARGLGANFGSAQRIDLGSAAATALTVGDLDGDRAAELFVATEQGLLWLRDTLEFDFGDAPAALYPTLLEQDGARHLIDGLALGQSVDADEDGQPSNAADGDDRNGDDEDGAVFGPLLLGAAQATVTVSTNEPGAGLLSVFLDGNRDDDFDDAGETVLRDLRLTQAEQTLSFALPVALQAGPSYARLRLSRAGGLGPGGYAASGEVEDHALTLRLPELRIRDAEVVEGDGPGQALEFALELEAPLTRSVSVGYVTRPESAQAQDFVPQEGRLTLTPGRTTHRIRVPVRGDTRVEGEETLTLLLREPEGVALPRTQATGRIIDDDVAAVSPSTAPSPTAVPTASPQPSATPAPAPSPTITTTPRPTPAVDGRLRDRRVAVGSVGLPLLRLVVGNPEAATALLQVVDIDLAELGRPRPDVRSARLYRDAGESGVFDAADALLATLEGPELSGDNWRFELPTPLSLGAGAEQALMVVVDLAGESDE